MSEPAPKPLPKVSAAKYAAGAAKVRFREKGKPYGPVYQGQVIVVPCKGCGRAPF
jgi:hypothetical protein